MEIIDVAILRVATTVAIEAVKLTIEAMSAMTLAGDLATTGLRKTESMTEEVEVDPLFSKKKSFPRREERGRSPQRRDYSKERFEGTKDRGKYSKSPERKQRPRSTS